MQINRTALGASLALALIVAACGSSSSASPSAAATQPAAPSQAANTDQPAATDDGAGATDQPAATDDNGGPGISFTPGSAPDLEAMLPATVNGVAFTRTSFSGGSLPASIPLSSDQMSKLLSDNGKTINDFSWAMATPTDTSAGTVFVIAIQVKGVDGAKVAEAFGGSDSGMKPATVGGKQVQQAGAGGVGAVLYVKGDTAFYILNMGNATLTEGIVAALP